MFFILYYNFDIFKSFIKSYLLFIYQNNHYKFIKIICYYLIYFIIVNNYIIEDYIKIIGNKVNFYLSNYYLIKLIQDYIIHILKKDLITYLFC